MTRKSEQATRKVVLAASALARSLSVRVATSGGLTPAEATEFVALKMALADLERAETPQENRLRIDAEHGWTEE